MDWCRILDYLMKYICMVILNKILVIKKVYFNCYLILFDFLKNILNICDNII